MNTFGAQLFAVLLSSTSPEPRAAPDVVSHCEGDRSSDTVVVNLPGFDYKTWGWVDVELGDDVLVCDYEIRGKWDDADIAAVHLDVLRFIREGRQVAIVAYSMTGPFAVEMLDTSEDLAREPDLLGQLSLLMVAPAAEVRSGLRGMVKRAATRWEHAWQVHFETNILGHRDQQPDWHDFIDRIHILKAERERIVDYGGISAIAHKRLGNNIHTVPRATHVSLRHAAAVTELLREML
jgi:hypothetical protein